MTTTYAQERLFTEEIDVTNDVLYAVAIGDAVDIKAFTITNTDSSDRTVEVWLVPNGSSPDDTNKLIDGRTIQANSTLIIAEALGQLVDSGGEIIAKASSANTLTAIGAGTVITVS